MIKFIDIDNELVKNASLIVQTVNPYGTHSSKTWHILSVLYPEALQQYENICELAKAKTIDTEVSPLMGTLQEIYIDHPIPHIHLWNRTIVNLYANDLDSNNNKITNYNAFRSTLIQFKTRFKDTARRLIICHKCNSKHDNINYMKSIILNELSDYDEVYVYFEPARSRLGSKYFYGGEMI